MMKRGLKILLVAVLILCCMGSVALASSTGGSTLTNDINADLLVRAENGVYQSMTGTNGVQAFTGSVYWEPGRTQIAYLKIVNSESASIYAEVVLDVSENDFGTTLEYAVINQELLQANHPANWAEFKANADATGTIRFGETSLFSRSKLDANKSQYLAVAIHMREDAKREEVSFDANGSAVLNMQFKLRSERYNNGY